MNRRRRRRLYVLGVAALVGATATVWAPPLLSRLELFRVDRVEVGGNRYVAAEEILALASIGPEASVWDDPALWERAVREHRLVRGARVSRVGVDRLLIRVREVEPVALVPTPRLVPVDAEGRVLPLDPAVHGLDLPLLRARPDSARLRDEGDRSLLDALVRLRRTNPDFVREASEFGRGGDGEIRISMTDGERCDRILLPAGDPVRALRRVEMALGHERAAVETADARFDGQVVLRLRGGG